jgi:hypothetical protein
VAKYADGMKSVTSPYVVLWADDDFLVPRALELRDRLPELESKIELLSLLEGFAAAREIGRCFGCRAATNTVSFFRGNYVFPTSGPLGCKEFLHLSKKLLRKLARVRRRNREETSRALLSGEGQEWERTCEEEDRDTRSHARLS